MAGLAQAIEAGRAPDPATAPEVPADCIVALICPYAAMTAERSTSRSSCADADRRSCPPAADADGRARPPAATRAADAA